VSWWEWLKSMVAKLPKLLPRRQAQEKPEPAPGQLTELDKKLGREIQKRQAKEGKAVSTTKGGPNMPRYQPCPKGCGLKRIVDKAVVGGVPGALYYCNHCKQEFFVSAKGV
jgi:hypothetical protein